MCDREFVTGVSIRWKAGLLRWVGREPEMSLMFDLSPEKEALGRSVPGVLTSRGTSRAATAELG
jgi:hypothetical protein